MIDLGGHTLTVTTGAGILAYSATQLTIRSGTINGSLFISPDGFEPVVTVRNVHVTGHVTLFGGGATIHGSVIDGSVDDSGEVDILTHDVIGGGITGDDGQYGGTRVITHSLITGGIRFIDYFSRLDLEGKITDNTVTGSTGDGIQMDGIDELTFLIARNRVEANAGSAITVGTSHPISTGAQVTITRNTVVNNGGYGIDVLPTPNMVIDGGHNTASGNDLSPQCIGVVCKPLPVLT